MIKKNNLYVSILFVSVMLTSCIGRIVYEEKLTLGYELSANDDMSGMCIYVNDGQYQIGVIHATVFSVGYNQDFIIAKQHPFVGSVINKSITNYYIISIKDKINASPDENKIGPLTQEMFLIKRKELEIPDNLDFSITIDKLK
ncbi:DUF3997 domain-containing protein [Marinilabiliaceae bacterium JC017]|nr:DUF3997 domain-containing protein [Marinilabiliaceae bacterium JC017]